MGTLLALAAIIFALVLRGRILDLKSELEFLKSKIERLEVGRAATPIVHAPVVAETSPSPAVVMPERIVPAVVQDVHDPSLTFIDESDDGGDFEPPFPGDAAPAKEKPTFNFEQQFGAKLPVWIGGISLALAGFYMVKYSIDNNLVSPTVRVILGMLMGLGFIAAGRFLAVRPKIANAERICQALSGAGITCLYGGFFAASSLYHLIPPAAGFIGMVAVTIWAVLLSLSQGPAVAIFGLVGGFLTPILIGSDQPNTMLLFIYLSALSLSLLFVARRQRWDWLALPVYALSLLWALGWVMGTWVAVDAIWVSIYLLVLLCAAPLVFHRADAGEQSSVTSRVASGFGCLGSLVMLSLITARAEFSSLHWSMFGLAGLGSIALAVFKPRLYSYAPAVAGAVTATLLLLWQSPDMASYLKIACVLGVVYFAAGASFTFRTQNPVWWSKLAVLTLPLLYVITYCKYGPDVFGAQAGASYWTWAALAVAAVSVALTASLQKKLSPQLGDKDQIVAVSALLSVSFLSWGFYLSLDGAYLMLAYALQIAAIAWLAQRFSYSFIGITLRVAEVLFIVSLLPYGQELISLIASRHYIVTSSSPLPLLSLAGSALLIGGAAFLNMKPEWKTGLWAIAGLTGLATVFGVLQLAAAKIDPVLPESVFWRSLTLNLTWLAALSGVWWAQKSGRSNARLPALMLLGYAAAQTILVDLLFFFPDKPAIIGELPLLNALIPAYALPAAYFCVAGSLLSHWKMDQYRKGAEIAFLFFAMLFVTCEVSHFFHVPYLDGYPHPLAEIYSYSVVWLLSGICLLVAGTLKGSRLYRVTSLLVIGGTVCKVFLYDASELDGILRVLSFLGLGLSLLGLSFFYTRFVFRQNDKP